MVVLARGHVLMRVVLIMIHSFSRVIVVAEGTVDKDLVAGFVEAEERANRATVIRSVHRGKALFPLSILTGIGVLFEVAVPLQSVCMF